MILFPSLNPCFCTKLRTDAYTLYPHDDRVIVAAGIFAAVEITLLVIGILAMVEIGSLRECSFAGRVTLLTMGSLALVIDIGLTCLKPPLYMSRHHVAFERSFRDPTVFEIEIDGQKFPVLTDEARIKKQAAHRTKGKLLMDNVIFAFPKDNPSPTLSSVRIFLYFVHSRQWQETSFSHPNVFQSLRDFVGHDRNPPKNKTTSQALTTTPHQSS